MGLCQLCGMPTNSQCFECLAGYCESCKPDNYCTIYILRERAASSKQETDYSKELRSIGKQLWKRNPDIEKELVQITKEDAEFNVYDGSDDDIDEDEE